LRIALTQAEREIEQESHEGGLSAKPATLLRQALLQALERIPALSVDIPAPNARDLVAKVPLFEGLPIATLNEVAARAQLVRFLGGDVIIGEDEHGDALYLIAQGRVDVSRRAADGCEHLINSLSVGDFFGETALLGEHVRSASVLATQSCALLRLTRRDVLAMAKKHHSVAQRLQRAERAHAAESRRFAQRAQGMPNED
jgi:CRP-like cAMP-binding protein